MSNQIIGPVYYQSPIDCKNSDIGFKINSILKSKGINIGATLSSSKNYVIDQKSPMLFKFDDKKHIMTEYHFHTDKSEHALNGVKYDAECHQVFVKHSKGQVHKFDGKCICDGHFDKDEEYLVVATFVNFDTCIKKNLNKLQFEIPESYFLMDGTLTTNSTDISNNYTPVKFLINESPINISAKSFNSSNSKGSRALQPSDNRILLHN